MNKMNKKEVLEKAKSYSAYRGITCRDRYGLTDKYIWAEVNGNIICTDQECDIGKEGNIVLVTPDFDVLHIGTVPIPETGTVSFRMDNNFLKFRYTVWYDNSHHHGDYEEEIIDCTLTEERKKMITVLRKADEISALGIRGYMGGAYRNTFEINEDLEHLNIELYGKMQKALRFSMSKPQYAKQKITYRDGKFELQPPVDGYLEIKEVIRNRDKMETILKTIME